MVSERKAAMMRLNIPFTDERELEEIAKVLATGYLTQGPKTAEFEQKVAEYIGCQYAFAMSSCTTALHLALVVLDIKPGDEVLVADFTFPATANVVVQLGAIPVLVDIDLDTFTMNTDDLRRNITARTKAIIPVDAFGCAADYDPILQIAVEHNLPVIEDAATSIGTKYYERFCGNLATLGCFSFHPRKVITTGEGGMITTNDAKLAEKIKLLRSHGGVKVGYWYQFEEAGFNYRLSDIQGAMGVAQMEKLPGLIQRKRELANKLSARLSDVAGIRTPIEPKWLGHIYQSYVILVEDRLDRDSIIKDMKERRIETTLGTYALHDQPFFRREFNYKRGQLPNSHAAFTRTITLPLYPQMDEHDLDTIADNLNTVIRLQLSKL
jgi:dTDP-4-amino-4,6-dideoxygalactose transaminase